MMAEAQVSTENSIPTSISSYALLFMAPYHLKTIAMFLSFILFNHRLNLTQLSNSIEWQKVLSIVYK